MPAGLNWRFWTGLMYGTAYLDNFEELGAFQAGPSDVEAPVFDSVSVNIAANATSWAGADVSYTLPGAIDNIDPSPQVSCSPASGGCD